MCLFAYSSESFGFRTENHVVFWLKHKQILNQLPIVAYQRKAFYRHCSPVIRYA